MVASFGVRPPSKPLHLARHTATAGLVSMSLLSSVWIRFVVGSQMEWVDALDWTEFSTEDQSVLAPNPAMSHGPNTPGPPLRDARRENDGKSPGARPSASPGLQQTTATRER